MPSAITPNVDDGEVWSAAQVGSSMVLGGNFTKVGGVARSGIAVIDADTGALSTTFAPTLAGGQVYSVQPGPNNHTVYVGGDFTSVNGTATKYLTLLDTVTGGTVSGFAPPVFNYGGLRDMVTVGNRLIVGGFFTTANNLPRQGLASMSATTGALDSYLQVQLAGHHNDTGSGAQGYTGPWSLDASPDGSRLVVTGNFKTANGLLRDQLAMIDLNASSSVVDPNWATNRYAPYCFNWAFDGYTRGVSFSPDGTWFAVNATGGGNAGTLCDATSRFETTSTGTDIQPTWVDETGGDTVWGVTITNTAVYIGGHNRWENNPLGVDQALPGAVPRPGLAALDPVNGRPYSWNPGHKPLGKAVYALLATPKGVWMAYDQDYIGNFQYLRKKIAFFPYSGGSVAAATTTGNLPGTVYTGSYTSNGPTNVLYRVDAGGPSIDSSDGGPAWSEDTASSPSQYRNQQSNTADYGPVNALSPSVPAGTPPAIFDHELWSPTDSPPQDWTFPVAAGTHVTVRLYFANRYSGTSGVGQRTFDVNIDGTKVLNNYDIVADAGDQTGTMKPFDITVPSNGKIDIALLHRTENPLINGIEIVNKDVAPPPPPTDTLSAIGFDGNTATAPQPVSGSNIAWGQTRGAFTVGKKLFFGATDGTLHVAPVNGSTIGNATAVNPYHDPAWKDVQSGNGTTFDGANPQLYSQLANVTGMFFNNGKLYFTLSGDSSLHWAWFSPDSGIVDNTESTATSSVDFSKADGMFVSGNKLYFVSKTNGSLYSVGFDGTSVSGTPNLINGPTTGGVDWTNKSLFFIASPPANQPPTASFTSTCTAGGCAVDGSSSTDPDGSIATYEWNFGDGGTATGVSPSHTYTATGNYTITLKVTDNGGASNTTSKQINIASVGKQITFVGASHSAPGSSVSKSAAIPSGTVAGDTMVAVLTTPTGQNWGSPGAGWTQVSTLTNVSIVSTMWTKTATSGDLTSPVTVTNTASAKAVLGLAVYDGVAANAVDGYARVGDSGGFSHATPNAAVSAGDTVVSFWTDKSNAVSAWTAPGSVKQRDVAYDSGTSGRMSLLLADSNGPVAAGPYGGLIATTDTASDKAIMWTLALKPSGAANANPTASFTSSCTGLTCNFDASASTDSDGTIASYAWDFGDGGTATGKTPSHTYSGNGTQNVVLTVTDNGGGTGTQTKAVTVSSSSPTVSYIGSGHASPGATRSKSVAVPTGTAVGDTMLLVFTSATGQNWSGPGAGWTQVSTLTNVSVVSTLWSKTVTAGDVGSTVSMTNSSYLKAGMSLSVYRGLSATAPIDAFARVGDAGGTNHTTPTVTAAAGDLVASFWENKSTSVSLWTPPSTVTKRDAFYDNGTSGRFDGLLADSGTQVAAGAYGGLTATTDSASDKAIMWTVALKPA